MVSLGPPFKGRLIPLSQPSYSQPLTAGKVYQVNIKTGGVGDPAGTLNRLNTLFAERGVQMIYGEVVNNTMIVQFKPQQSGLFLNTLIALLPLIGVAVTSFLAFVVTYTIPKWVWGLAAGTIILLFILPRVIKK